MIESGSYIIITIIYMLWGAIRGCVDPQWINMYVVFCRKRLLKLGNWPKYERNFVRFPMRICMLGLLRDAPPMLRLRSKLGCVMDGRAFRLRYHIWMVRLLDVWFVILTLPFRGQQSWQTLTLPFRGQQSWQPPVSCTP